MERRYGDNKTIHGTQYLDIETDQDGNVIAVWFRCQPLRFAQSRVGQSRANEMYEMYRNQLAIPPLLAVVVED